MTFLDRITGRERKQRDTDANLEFWKKAAKDDLELAHKYMMENIRLKEENERLREAAEHVTWFDWSNNDPDAVAAVDELQKALSTAKPSGDGG